MKKRLLLQLFAVFCVLGSYAYNTGDYIYTPTAKFKVTGDNLLTNGSFTDGTSGWTGADGNAVSTASWDYVAGGGPSGQNVLQSLDAAAGNALAYTATLAPGIYSVTYKIKAPETLSTSVTVGGANYADMFVNTDASLEKASTARTVAEVNTLTAEWKTIDDTVQIAAGEFLIIYFDRMAAGTMVTDFEIHTIQSVYDTRIAERTLQYADMLLTGEHASDFTNGREDFLGVVDYLKAVIAKEADVNPDDATDMTTLMDSYQEALKAFMDANSADMMPFISHWVGMGKQQKSSGMRDWVLTGGRWFHMNSSSDIDNEIYSTIQGSYDLVNASATVTKKLSPGKYMFSLDVKAFLMAGTGTAVRYTPNYESNLTGGCIFLNGDTLDLGVMDERNYQTYTIFKEVKEGEDVTFGAAFTLPEEHVGKKLGGSFNIANPVLRNLSTNADIEAHKNLVDGIATAQNALKVMLDSAKVVYAKPEYKWGKAVLNDSIALAQGRYDASLAKINAEGVEVSVDDDADVNYAAELNTYMGYMRTGIQKLYALNAPYFTLVADVETAQASYDGEQYAGADAQMRTALKAEIDAANALIAAYAEKEGEAASADSLAYVDRDNTLKVAKQNFEMSCASYAVPASIAITNPFFTSNISGWTLSANDTSKENFKRGADENFDNGYRAQVWRGYTASPQSKFIQKVTLTVPGIYEYRASAQAHNENTGCDLAMATLITDEESGLSIDTIFNKSEVKMLFGPDGAPDSVRVHSRMQYYSGSTVSNGYIPGKYSVYYVKTSSEAEVVELGMCSYGQIDREGANTYGFGDNYIYYCGNATNYLADLKAAANADIATAQALVDANKESADKAVQNAVSRLSRRLADAQAAVAGSEYKTIATTKHYINELAAKLSSITTGVSQVTIGGEIIQKAVKNGVYSMTGMRVADTLEGLKSLPRGIYIFNGKKYVVK